MNKEFLCYLAGPISGLSYGETTEWREYVREAFPDYIMSLSPMRGKGFLGNAKKIADTYNDDPLSTEKGINQRDFNDVKRSDVILCNLLGAKAVSIGTMFEIAWARQFNIPLVLVMEKEGNIHDHAFVRYASGFITDNIDKGIEMVKQILGPDKILK